MFSRLISFNQTIKSKPRQINIFEDFCSSFYFWPKPLHLAFGNIIEGTHCTATDVPGNHIY